MIWSNICGPCDSERGMYHVLGSNSGGRRGLFNIKDYSYLELRTQIVLKRKGVQDIYIQTVKVILNLTNKF